MTDPKRLLTSDELSPEWRDALQVLRQQSPPVAAIARVQRTLDNLPPAAPVRPALGLGSIGFVGLVLVLAMSAAWVVNHVRPDAEKDTKSTPQPTSAVRPVPAKLLKSEPQPEPRVQPVARDPQVGTRGTQPRLRRDPGAGKALRGSKPAAATTPAAAPDHVGEVSSDTALVMPPTAAERRDLPVEPVQPPTLATRVPVATSQAPDAEPADEAGLLFRAKRLAVRDPRAALHLLETHAFYFPNGAFVQEREVLAIALHEKLGDHEKAQRLAAQFRARFPHSVYRGAVLP